MRALMPGHQDVVFDIAYDYYGKRLATCSADHTVRLFEYKNGAWELRDSWRAHDAAVVRVSWAGPQYSHIIATGSHDCTVKIWEEDYAVPEGSGKRWKKRFTISEFKGPLYDVQFSPSHSTLKLASIASDGVLRIHEALEPNNVGYWTSMAEISLLDNPVARQLQSSFAISWCSSIPLDDHLAVCVLDDAFVYRRDSAGKFVRVTELQPHKGLVRDIAWAPSMGRSYQLIATACKDGYVRVFRLTGVGKPEIANGAGGSSCSVELAFEDSSHNGEVRRVAWNTTGTILTSTGDDSQIKLWKSTAPGRFQCMSVVSADARTGDDVAEV